MSVKTRGQERSAKRGRPASRDKRVMTVAEPINPPGNGGVLDEGERNQMIARAAYFRAERRGFAPGSELDDWLAAEIEIARAR